MKFFNFPFCYGHIVLMPQDFKVSVEGVLEAVKNGEISEERIDESVLRIIQKKIKMK